MTLLAAVLGHQGGWDEVAFITVPIAMFAGLLALANKRASAMLNRDAEPGEILPETGDILPPTPDAD